MSRGRGTRARMCSRGGEIVNRHINRLYVPLRWVGAMAQVQVVQPGLSDHQVAMAVFTPEYLQMPPRARKPTWMMKDRELMEAWAQDIRTQVPPFPE